MEHRSHIYYYFPGKSQEVSLDTKVEDGEGSGGGWLKTKYLYESIILEAREMTW